MKRKSVLLFTIFTVSLTTVVASPRKKKEPTSELPGFIDRVRRNKATYAFLGGHVAGVLALALAPLPTRTKSGIAAGTVLAHCLLLGRPFKNSYFQGLRFEQEAESLEQRKILNATDWLEKNGVIIDGVAYTRGFELWGAYERAENKRFFLRQFLAVVSVDSSARQTRQVISVAIEALKGKLAQCSDYTHERYTNAGLLLGKFFYRTHVYPGKKFPHNIANWIWQEERGGDLFKTPLGNAYFEEYLNDTFLSDVVHAYEKDFWARIFSLTPSEREVAGFKLPWHRVSSWSRNGAARYYVALLKQYVFLLACRALCDQVIASHVVEQKQDIYW